MLLVHARRVSRHALGLLTLAAVLAGSAASAQTTFVVTTQADENNTDGQCSLREAVRAANTNTVVADCGAAAGSADGDRITFAPTVTIINLAQGEILISDDVTVDGTSNTRVTIDAGQRSRIFDIDAASGAGAVKRVRFQALSLRNGFSGAVGSSAPNAGGAVDLKTNSAATFTDVDVTGSIAGINGGGIHGGSGTDIVITATAIGRSTISGNDARGNESNRGGGGVWGAGTVTITGPVAIQGNLASGTSGSGGGVFNLGGTLTIDGAFIGRNRANRAGGGIESTGGRVVVRNVTFDTNNGGTNPGNGGGFHGGGDTFASILASSVQGNQAVEGAGLWISGSGVLQVENVLFLRNRASGNDADKGGGGIYNDGGQLSVAGSQFDDNHAVGVSGSGGAILNNGGTLSITGGTISGNTSNRAGGGVESAGGTVTIRGTSFVSNNAGSNPGNGGAVHAGGATTLTIDTGEHTFNRAVEGGALWISSGTTLTVTGVRLTNNIASGDNADQGGGGFYNEGGRATITGATFQSNKATGTSGSGGAILNNLGTVTVRNSMMAENTSNRAGGAVEDRASAVNNSSSLSLIGVTIHNNSAGANPGNGGGLHVSGAGRVTIDSSRVTSNAATKEGGAIWNSGSGSVRSTYTSVTGNSAAVGAGLYQQGGSEGILIFRNGLVAANAASGVGGGLALDGGTVEFSNSTISGNRADTGAGAVARGGRLLLSNATVANNSATTRGGGLANLSAGDSDNDPSNDPPADASAVSVDNTIVADNSAPTGPDVFGPVMSRGYNLFETTAGGTITMGDNASASTDITGVDPGLQPLADNGGPTRTQAIALSSPAVNAGRTSLTIDQRGVTRRGTADIGAFESDAAGVANEDFDLGSEELKISQLAPNPFRDTAELTFAVRESQNVRVVLYDVMGREVRVLLDGAVAGSTSVDLTVDGRGLASGVYVLVVRGETVQATRQITVAR